MPNHAPARSSPSILGTIERIHWPTGIDAGHVPTFVSMQASAVSPLASAHVFRPEPPRSKSHRHVWHASACLTATVVATAAAAVRATGGVAFAAFALVAEPLQAHARSPALVARAQNRAESCSGCKSRALQRVFIHIQEPGYGGGERRDERHQSRAAATTRRVPARAKNRRTFSRHACTHVNSKYQLPSQSVER